VRVRMGVLAVALAVALSACSDDPESEPESKPQSSGQSGSPDAPFTEVTVDCPEFEDVAQRILDAQAAIYTGAGGPEEIDDLVAELDALKEGAPEDVQTALTDMGEGFRDAAELLERPTRKNRIKLVELAPKLSENGQAITTYITAECG